MIGSTLSRLGCVLIGHMYPVYRTFKAFRLSDDPSHLDEYQLDDLRRILSYWAVMGVFTFAEFFLDFFMSWIPLFFETKILFLLWLVHSNFTGAKFVYENFIDEVFRHHEVDIDHSLAVCKAQARQKASGAAGVVASYLATTIAMALSKSQDIMLEKLSGQHQHQPRDSGFRFEQIPDSNHCDLEEMPPPPPSRRGKRE